MGYEEEIWDRREGEIRDLRSYEQIVSWLISDGKGNIIRKQSAAIRDIAKNLAKPFEVLDQVETEKDISRLRDLRKDSYEVSEMTAEVQTTIDEKIQQIEDQREAQRIAEREALREEVFEEIEEADTIEEAEEVLEAPETRRVKGATKETRTKLRQLESRQRQEVRDRLINEVMTDRGLSDCEGL